MGIEEMGKRGGRGRIAGATYFEIHRPCDIAHAMIRLCRLVYSREATVLHGNLTSELK